MKLTRLIPSTALLLLSLGAFGGPVPAQTFPPITDEERSLTSVAGEPNAPAVILFKKADFTMWGYDTRGAAVSSRLLVHERRKILTEQGKDLAEVPVVHDDDFRLISFKGRTVLPDGRVVPLGDDARFERKLSKRYGSSVTTVTFPAVEVGAILDSWYELRFESIYILEPWYFSDTLPVRRAEMVFKIPSEIQASSWSSDPFQVGIKTESQKSSRGTEVRVWAENLPSVPDEPHGFPFDDLATRMMMVPTAYSDGYQHTRLLESWQSVCGLFEEEYRKARRKHSGVAKKVKEITAAAGPGARERAEALYRFVRDEIETEDIAGIGLGEGASVDKTLSAKRGSHPEKALLLESMLRAAGLEARIVWAADRFDGRIDPAVANPRWFETTLVALDLEGQWHYLNPSDRALAFGRLYYGHEGMPALLPDAKKPEGVVLPETPFDQSGRRAMVDLVLDAEGRLAGKGELTFTGHHAWEKIDWQDDEAATRKAWQDWLDAAYKGFHVEEVRFEELPDEQKVRLTWSLRQRDEEVLGDESSLAPSAPLGPVRQPFVQEAAKRRSPVLFSFADRDEVELRLSWPEGWELAARPREASLQNQAGAVSVGLEVEPGGRSLVYRRRLDVRQRELISPQLYEETRSLFGSAEKSDAEALVLVRR